MKLEYKFLHGSYYLFDTDQKPSVLDGTRAIRLMSDQISVLYDPIDGIVFKHGAPDAVRQQYDRMKNLNEELVVVTSDKWDLVELNRLVSTSGYAKIFHENTFGVDQPGRVENDEETDNDSIGRAV